MKIANQNSGVLFDLDGTLIDTAEDMTNILLDMIQKYDGDKKISMKVARNYVSDGSIGLVKLGFPRATSDKILELQKIYLSQYQKKLCIHTKFFHSLKSLTRYLEKNNIKWGIVTNKPTRMTLPLLAKLDEHIQHVISGDTITKRKPDPEPLNLACNMMGISAHNSIYVGDAKRDIDAGNLARMKTIAVNYGYIKKEDDITKWKATIIVDTPSQLSAVIKKELNL